MTETDPKGDWLHRRLEGPSQDATKSTNDMFGMLKTFGDSDLVADVSTILRFSTSMGLYSADLSQRMVDGIFSEYGKRVGDLSMTGVTLQSANDLATLNNSSIVRFLDHVAEMGLTTTAAGMAAQAVAVEYINADGKGSVNIQNAYGQDLKAGQDAMFTTGPDNKTQLSEAAKSPAQKSKDEATRKEQERQDRELKELLEAPATAREAKEGVHAPKGAYTPLPVSEDQPLLPGPGGWGSEDWKPYDDNGISRPASGGEIIIEADDEAIELP